MLFVANPYGGKGETQGGVSGRSISVLIGGALDEASRHLWVPLVGHEVVHIWNGKAINFREQEYWFSEGFTEYYSRVVSVRIQSMSQTPIGDLIIHKSPAYQDGDNLMAINGMPVDAFEDIAKLAKDWHSGDVVELTIGRSDTEITRSVTLGGTSEKPPLDAGLVDVTVTKRANSTAAQRAVLTGILGESE